MKKIQILGTGCAKCKKLTEEAEKAAKEREKRALEQQESFMLTFRMTADGKLMTADGKLATEESLYILRQAWALGYKLEVQNDRTITATRPGKAHTSYLRSNGDIQKFGRFEGLSKERR